MKVCKTCSKELTGKWQKEYCSRGCSNTSRKKIRLCKNCDKELHAGKVYCSVKCQQDYQQKTWVQSWINGEIEGSAGTWHISGRIRRWLHEQSNNSCTKCGWNKVNEYTGKVSLQVNHIDGNWKNHRPENLELICPNCHTLTENYGARNKGNGRYIAGKPQPVGKKLP